MSIKVEGSLFSSAAPGKNNSSNNSANSIFNACYEGKLKLVEAILEQSPELAASCDEDQRRPIHWCASGGQVEVAQFLCDKYQQVTLDCPDDAGWTPLHIAASAGHAPFVDFLLSFHQGKYKVESKEFGPLSLAVDVNAANETGQTALHYACSKGRSEIALALLAHGANILVTDGQGQTILHRLALKGHLAIVKRLMTAVKGTNGEKTGYLTRSLLDAKDKQGNTALHYACEEGNGELARLLIDDCGCSGQVQNREKKTPLELCSPQLQRFLARYFE